MSDAISVHDNHLLRYSVLAEEKKIVFETEYPGRTPRELTDVVFEDVLAYAFENDLFGTIIFDIEEVDLAALLKEHAAMFEAGWRYGWPRGWEKEKETIGAFTTRLGMHAFELSSSYGMSGWIIAKQMSKIRKEANQIITDNSGASPLRV
jgi:hypothetical protein